MSDYFELINRRESCRNYDASRPVEREKLEKCIEAARLAPSACNSQPWSFFVVTEPALHQEICSAVQDLNMNAFASSAPALTVVVEEEANLSEKTASRFKKQDFASIDLGLATSQYCYAATEQGLSTCILGWLNEKKIKEALHIPEARRVRLVIATGYAAGDGLRMKKRKPMEEIARFL